jgi:multidrug efflux pump subunit AcrA (membrane-fusion protein)
MKFKYLIGTVIFIPAFLLTVSGCSKKVQDSKKNKKPIIKVGYIYPKIETFKESLKFTANLDPILQTNISPDQSGWLKAVYVHTGDTVHKGELVAKMDNTQQKAAVRQAEANLENQKNLVLSLVSNIRSSYANIRKEKAIVENDKLNLTREKSLLLGGYIPLQQYDDSKTTYLADRATLESLRSQMMSIRSQLTAEKEDVRQAEAALAIARKNLRDTYLKSPFSGKVMVRYLDPGAYLATMGSSNPIMSIVDPTRLKIVVDVPDKDAPLIKKGEPAAVTVDAYSGKIYHGTITRFAGAVNPMTRTLRVEIDIPNPDESLKPGMYAHASIQIKKIPHSIVLPIACVVKSENKSFVWVLPSHQSFPKKVQIDMGRIEGGFFRVKKGLTGKEKIILDGKSMIHHGVKIIAVPAEKLYTEVQVKKRGY